MESKNLRKKIFTHVSNGLVGIALLGLTACATPSKKHHQVLNSKGEVTEMYLGEETYKKAANKRFTLRYQLLKGFMLKETFYLKILNILF